VEEGKGLGLEKVQATLQSGRIKNVKLSGQRGGKKGRRCGVRCPINLRRTNTAEKDVCVDFRAKGEKKKLENETRTRRQDRDGFPEKRGGRRGPEWLRLLFLGMVSWLVQKGDQKEKNCQLTKATIVTGEGGGTNDSRDARSRSSQTGSRSTTGCGSKKIKRGWLVTSLGWVGKKDVRGIKKKNSWVAIGNRRPLYLCPGRRSFRGSTARTEAKRGLEQAGAEERHEVK